MDRCSEEGRKRRRDEEKRENDGWKIRGMGDK